MGRPFASLEKAIEILSLFDSEHQGLSAREISRMLSIPLSTTYKYLDLFLRKGFLSKDARTRELSLGLGIFKMGNLAAERISIVDIALPYMHSLSVKSGETVTLTVLHGMEGLCVETVESPRIVRLTIRKGSTLPLHAGASQKVLLAYQDESFIDAMIEEKGLAKLNENTITDAAQLKNELELIRKQGFTQSVSEVDAGAGSIGAPVFDHSGGVTAGLTLVGPANRILGENRESLMDMVTDSARSISMELGYGEGERKHP
ncbi:MAG: IclR family transcriptional regulator [Deltaproteobacteria bacterium]|nr:IclR family transcriptional regulator [Deltaproteobacteria bacterium]